MHPLLASPRRLGLYLLVWIPFAVLVHAMLRNAGMDGDAAGLLTAGMTLLLAFLVLSAYYSCRLAPLPTSVPRAVGVQGAAAVSTTALWLGAAAIATIVAEQGFENPGLVASFGAVLPALAGLGVLVFAFSVASHYLAMTIERSRDAERRALELQVVAREAELKVLRAQIDPHFLFNCLHSIASLTTTDPSAARTMCVRLGDFLRTSLKVGQQPFISLGEELSLVRGYLGIEQVRLGARLQVGEQTDPAAASIRVPPLLLHPLVENAVTHGIGHLIEGGRIDIGVELDGASRVRVLVGNTCDADRPRSRGTGVGLQNVRRRLATVYAHQASLTVREHGDRFEAELVLPSRVPLENADVRPPAVPSQTFGSR